jgi:hypothetical protein
MCKYVKTHWEGSCTLRPLNAVCTHTYTYTYMHTCKMYTEMENTLQGQLDATRVECGVYMEKVSALEDELQDIKTKYRSSQVYICVCVYIYIYTYVCV